MSKGFQALMIILLMIVVYFLIPVLPDWFTYNEINLIYSFPIALLGLAVYLVFSYD